MIGAIIGDVVGSRFEFENYKGRDFEFFHPDCHPTDDTVMTCAVAEALVKSWYKDKFNTLPDVAVDVLRNIGYWYPYCGFGAKFINWIYSDKRPEPYNSCGNGSAMRISPVGEIARDIEEAKDLSYAVTAISHNHPEGIKGAEAVAVAIVLARQGKKKKEIRKYIEDNYYELNKTVKDYRMETIGHGKEICQISVPQAFVCFLEGRSFRDVIRNCISIGGDSDTIAAIAGGMAEAFYDVKANDARMAWRYLDTTMRDVICRFEEFKNGNAAYDVGDEGTVMAWEKLMK